jgi:hypothetical protein
LGVIVAEEEDVVVLGDTVSIDDVRVVLNVVDVIIIIII